MKRNVSYEKSRRKRLRGVGRGEIYSYRRFDGLCPECGINDRQRSQAYCNTCRSTRAREARSAKKLEG
jgi:hypothetical protein